MKKLRLLRRSTCADFVEALELRLLHAGIGSADVSESAVFAWMSGSTLNIAFDGTATPILLDTSSTNVTAAKDGETLSFSGVTQILALGTSSGDNLQIHAPLSPSLTFNNGSGNDTVKVTGGTYTFASDLSPILRNVSVTIDIGAIGVFNTIQHLNGLTVIGTAVANALLVTQSLSIKGVVDLNDNDLIIDYTSVSPLGAWNGSAYSGVSGLIVSGNNGGSWNGFGLVPTEADAQAGLTTLGAGEASGVLNLSGSETGLFSGQTVDATSVLVKYTYFGDTNLDGLIDGTDYFFIDSNIGTSINGYANGDFNYDGIIDGTDYFYIDSNITNQGAFASAAGGFNYDGFIDETDYANIDFSSDTPGALAYFNGDFNDDGDIDAKDGFYIDSNIATQGTPL